MNNINELKNRIFNEDCISENINEGMNRIPDKSIDMILCDLPYGTTACKWDTIIPFDKLWQQYNRIIKDNGAIVLFGMEPFSSLLRISNLKNYRYDWVWNKVNISNPMLAKKQPLNSHENISVFYKKQCIYNPQMEVGTMWKRGGKGAKHSKNESMGIIIDRKCTNDTTNLKYPKRIITFSNANRVNRLHPTQKPVDLLEYLIKTYTNEGDVVLDNCIGSGSTAIACLNTNRYYIGFEKDKGYYDIANNRINTYLEDNN